MLATGFGPFPGMPENASGTLVRALAAEPPDVAERIDLRTLVLPTDYRRSWPALTRAWRRFEPRIILHFGVSRRATSIVVETRATRRIDPAMPDAAGFAPAGGFSRRAGRDELPATVDAEAVVRALAAAGIPAELSNDAGLYLCNATFYRSLARAAGTSTAVGFIHVPPFTPSWSLARLHRAATVALTAIASENPAACRPPSRAA